MAPHKIRKFSPMRRAMQMATARYALAPIYLMRNRPLIVGQKNVPNDRPVLVVANHLSYWDPPLLCIATDKPLTFVAKKELFENPFLRPFVELYCSIPVNREKPGLSTIKAVRQVFQDGYSVGMFIEGTRSRVPNTLGAPHLGPAYIAKTNKVSILPVGLVGTNSNFAKVNVNIGQVMEASDDLEETTWRIMDQLVKLTGFSIYERRVLHEWIPANAILRVSH